MTLVVAAASTLALDMYVHSRLARYAALNIWGYRGPVVGRKKPNEYRIAMIGGSTVFGVAGSVDEAIPAVLERVLHTRRPQPVSVVNLGFNAENAYAFRAVLEDYQYLSPDLVIFYGQKNTDTTPIEIMRDGSVVYRLTGYYPLLPTALREKAMAIRYQGNLSAAYAHEPTMARPSIPARAAASILAALWSGAEYMSNRLEHVAQRPPERPVDAFTCGPPWKAYCDSMYRAIAYARRQNRGVLVAAQPEDSDAARNQQHALQMMIADKFGDDPNVRYLDLSAAVDLRDRAIAFDAYHLTPQGNRQVAERLAEYLVPWLPAR